MASKPAEFLINTRWGRVGGFLHFLRSNPRPKFGPLVARLENLAERGSPAEEIEVYRSVYSAMTAEGFPEAAAWARWESIRRRTPHSSGGKAPFALYSSGEADVLLRNLNESLRALRTKPAAPLETHVLLNGIVVSGALLTDHFRDQLLAGFEHAAPKSLRDELAAFLELSWLDEIPIPLSEVRNGWCHGYALLQNDTVYVFDRRTFELRAELAPSVLGKYITAARAVWQGVGFDFAALAAAEEAEHGQPIRLEPLEDRRARRRLPPLPD